jgi:glycerophosphoryl diester phosphodiesterase
MMILAHRGASKEARENTIAAFRLARAHGADGVELDVMRCQSGEVVVFHDDTLERIAGRPGAVRALPYRELKAVDLGGGERIPLLDEVLDEIGPLVCNVELKSAPTFFARAFDDGLAGEVRTILQRHAAEKRAIVSSFDPLLLLRFRLRAPSVATGLLFSHDQALPLSHAWCAPLISPAALHPEASLVDERHVAAWHRRGYRVHVWTVDAPDQIARLAALGVDAVITNRPKEARLVVRSY